MFCYFLYFVISHCSIELLCVGDNRCLVFFWFSVVFFGHFFVFFVDVEDYRVLGAFFVED